MSATVASGPEEERITRALDSYAREYGASRSGEPSPALRRARVDLVLALELAGEELPVQVRSQAERDVSALVDLTAPVD